MRLLGSAALTIAVLFLLALPSTGAEVEAGWDDGAQKGKQSTAGTGHVIRLEAPRRARWIQSVRIHGSRYGGGYDPTATTFQLAICHEDLTPIHVMEAPYALFASGQFRWVEVGLDRTFEVPDRFAVVVSFAPTATRGVFVGWAETTESHSAHGLPGRAAKPCDPKREWMIRAALSKKPPKGVPSLVEVRQDDGEKAGERSIGGGSHEIELRKPSGSWWLDSVTVFGKRYGGGFDPLATMFRVKIKDGRGKLLHEERAAYALFERQAFRWGKVPIRGVVKLPSRFRVEVDFEPTRTKGVYLGFTAAPRKKSEVAWMIRARLIDVRPRDAVPEPKPRTRDSYARDLDAIDKIVRANFPAFEKKGVDWASVVKRWRRAFRSCPNDVAHVLNATRLLAELGDMHSGVISPKVEAHVPSFDGLYGGGIWIANDRGRLLLRAMMPGHPLEAKVPLGATLLRIDGRPAGVVHEETRQKLKTWHGWSSDHFLDARLSFQFFPFGDKQRLELDFEGAEDVSIGPWGPQGRGLSRQAVTMPPGLEANGKAVSMRLDDELGYVRILGGMNEATRDAFFEALDRVREVKGILLDCRGMGGGGDEAAWAMAGRFFSAPQALAHDPTLKPTGAWQFEGPVVMLQDERMVSSAETFTWAMGETGRALTVGRPTGGATIIPRTFDVPSGLFRLRLGCRDRETSVKGVKPEGVGTPPEVFVGYEADLLQRHDDPIRAKGLELLEKLVDEAR